MDINKRENARCMYMFKYRCLSDSVVKIGQQQQQTNKQTNKQTNNKINSRLFKLRSFM